jgi:ATP-binding cassette subfamily B protein
MKLKSSPAAVREAVALLWSVSSPYVRRRVMQAVGLVVLTSALSAVAPLTLKWVVDALTAPDSEKAVRVTIVATLYVLCLWVERILSDLRSFLHALADRRINRSLSHELFRHVMSLPLRFHLNRRTGALSEVLSNGLAGCQMLLQTCAYTVLPVLVQLTTVMVILVSLHQPFFVLLFFIVLVVYGAAFAIGGSRTAIAARNASASQVEARALMTDSVLNYETVKYFAAERIVERRIEDALNRSESEWRAFFGARMKNGMLVGTIFALFLTATTGYAAKQAIDGHMTIGTFVLINTYIFQLVGPVEQVGYITQSLSQGLAFLQKMMDLFRERPEEESTSDFVVTPGPTRAGSLLFERVSASYDSGRLVLRDVSFSLPAGNTLGIVGASGAGKSTLVRLLVRFLEPQQGRILLDGEVIAELPLAQLRHAIAVVPQDTILFDESIAYNIAFGKTDCPMAEIEAAARVAHLHDFVMSLPAGYHTRVGERGVKLSGGEKQRVSIARAAIRHPKAYVFDEATSALDSNTEREILSNIRDLSRKCTTLIIAHRLSTVVHADEILVIDDGVVAERGSHAQLVRAGGRYAELWRLQNPLARQLA